eukprot:g20862.t1
MVCAKRLKDTLDDKEEVRCVNCEARGVCMSCWTFDRMQVSRFFTDPDRHATCFRCVTKLNEQNMDVFCERVQTACGTLSDEDAQAIVEQMDWLHKLEEARATKPSQVLSAYDLLRAVQGIAVTGRVGGDQQEIKVLQGQVRAQQAKVDRISNAMGDAGAGGGLRGSTSGDPGQGPLSGSLNNWVCKDVVETSEYKDMKSTAVKLSGDAATVEQRKNWANSAIRSHSKLVMFLFDTWCGQFRGGCRNCWVVQGGEPPEHSYQSCRSMKNKHNLICSNCNQYHDDWPECCPAISTGGAGGGDGDNSGKKGAGKRQKSKKMFSRQGGASGAGSWGSRNGNRPTPFS